MEFGIWRNTTEKFEINLSVVFEANSKFHSLQKRVCTSTFISSTAHRPTFLSEFVVLFQNLLYTMAGKERLRCLLCASLLPADYQVKVLHWTNSSPFFLHIFQFCSLTNFYEQIVGDHMEIQHRAFSNLDLFYQAFRLNNCTLHDFFLSFFSQAARRKCGKSETIHCTTS